MKLKLLVASFMLIVAAPYLNNPKAVTSDPLTAPCVASRTTAAVGFWTWPANAHVNIYLREPDFSEDYLAAVRTAVENWDAAAVENGSNVHFSFQGLTRETKTAQGDLTIIRGDVYNKKIRHLALLEAHSLRSNQLIDYALVVVDLRVRKPEVLTNVMAHELGHSLGLLDCYECSRKSTAMGLLKTENESNGIEGPTACDKIAVRAAYRELALHAGSAPTVLSAAVDEVDEGEEPEADQTPIVLARPPR
jgi:hypothetical protein